MLYTRGEHSDPPEVDILVRQRLTLFSVEINIACKSNSIVHRIKVWLLDDVALEGKMAQRRRIIDEDVKKH